jgi:glucokinase
VRPADTLERMTVSDLALAIDFGGTKIDSAFVDAEGKVLASTRFRQPTGPNRSSEELAANVTAAVSSTLAARPEGATILGAGIGAAGPLRVDLGLISPLNLPVWRDYPLKALIETLVPGVTVTLRMDGLAITLAEHWIGAAKGYDNVMGMIVSTGIGGGLILGGATVPGPTGNAGHIGHVEAAGFDDPCACGGRGCIEAIASGPNTVRFAQSRGWTGSTGEDLAAGYEAGDPLAIEAVKRSGRAIGQAIASTTNLVDLDLVAIGGGFSKVTPDLFDFIRSPIAQRREFDFVTRVKVVPSALSDDGPLIGAGALVHRASMVI